MSEFFLESPLLLGISGLLVAVAAIFYWTQTGGKAALVVAVAVGLLTLGLVSLSLQVETDREQIRRTLDEVATALEQNDIERVVGYIHPAATAGVQHAERELPQYEFSEARVTRIKSIVINSDTPPPTAIAEFNVVVGLGRQGQQFRFPRFVKVYFLKQGDRWLVQDYEHFEHTAGFSDTPYDVDD